MCLYAYIKAIPKSFCEETRFLVLGSNNPWGNHTSRHRVPTLRPSTACTKHRFWIISEVLLTHGRAIQLTRRSCSFLLMADIDWSRRLVDF